MSTVINARDFRDNTRDANRNLWSVGAMQCLIHVLDGARVHITTDKSTGHTQMNVEIIAARKYRTTPSVLIRSFWTAVDGTEQHQDTWFMINSIGMVLPADERGRSYKYDALALYRTIKNIGLAKIQAEHGTGREWGEWEVSLYSIHQVGVTYRPYANDGTATGKARGTGGYWTVTVTDDDRAKESASITG